MTIIHPILPEDIEHLTDMQRYFCYPETYVHERTAEELCEKGGYLVRFEFDGDEYAWGETKEESLENMKIFIENLA